MREEEKLRGKKGIQLDSRKALREDGKLCGKKLITAGRGKHCGKKASIAGRREAPREEGDTVRFKESLAGRW